MKKIFAGVLSLVLSLGFSAKPSYAEIDKETRGIVEQVCRENTKVPSSAVSPDIQKIMEKYSHLSRAEKKSVQKIFQQIQSNERKKSIKRFFEGVFEAVVCFVCLAVIGVATYYIAPVFAPID